MPVSPLPLFPEPVPTCTAGELFGQSVEDDIFLLGGPIRLLYFPVTTTTQGYNNCATTFNWDYSPVTQAPTGVGPNTFVSGAITFTSPSIYVSFASLFGTFVGNRSLAGTVMYDLILPQEPSAVKTFCTEFLAGPAGGMVINIADLNTPVPWSAYSCMLPCSNPSYDPANPATPWINCDHMTVWDGGYNVRLTLLGPFTND